MIKLTAIGHLGKDCVVNNVNGKTVINFNVAHSSKYKDAQGNNVTKTTWINCAYWTDKTGIAPYLKKGTQVYIEGEPEADFYNAGAAGIIGQQKCRIQKVELLGSAKSNDGQNQQGQQQQWNSAKPAGDGIPNATDITEPIDDLPF